MTPMPPALEDVRRNSAAKMDHLRQILRDTGGAVVAFSGGGDSAFVLAVACEVLGRRVVALTAHSPSVPQAEREEARQIAARLSARHLEGVSREGDDPRYRANGTDRCFYCKSELYRLCAAAMRDEGLPVIVDGFNADDRMDHRPGRDAAFRAGVRSPWPKPNSGSWKCERGARPTVWKHGTSRRWPASLPVCHTVRK